MMTHMTIVVFALRAIVGANVVALDGGEPVRDAVIVIEDDRIRALGPSSTTEIPAEAEIVRADGAWLVPGLINMHVHLGLVLPGRLAYELADETDAELALRMAKNARTMPFFERIGSPPWYLERVKTVEARHFCSLQLAIEEGVSIALGTDQFPFEPNDGTTATVREAEYYVEAGMTPLEALRAATIAPARLLGLEDAIGSITPGKCADIVALESDPSENISALRSLLFVIKSGRIYHNARPNRLLE